MDDFLTKAGKYASAASAVIALVALVVWKPFISRRKKIEAARKEEREYKAAVLEKLDAIIEDIADLQRDRLTQAHDFYVAQGYCPSDTKQVLVHMHRSYRAKGRNHLCDHYEQDILELPTDAPARAG